MEFKIEKNVKVTLVLDEVEATWLNELMRNPIIKECVPANEMSGDAEMRKKFFNATDFLFY